MNPADRNKILIAGGVALLAIVVIAFFLLRGRGRAPEYAAAGGGFAPGAAAPEATDTVMPGAPGAFPAPGEVMPAAPGVEVAEAVGPAPRIGVVEMGVGPTEPTREDPFLSFVPPPQPTPPELMVSLPPVGLVPGGLRPPGAALTGPRIANRRVAGLLFNDQAWAILEDEDQRTTFVVKPGDVVDGIRITAISRDSIFVVDRDGQRWEVRLRGTGPEARVAAGVS